MILNSKRISAFFCSVLLFLATAMTALPIAHALDANLLANPSVETNNLNIPNSWSTDTYGTNNAAFSYLSTGHTGGHSLNVKMSAYSNGDAKWYPTGVPVSPNTTYTYSDWYQSNIVSSVDIVITSSTGGISYIYQGSPIASTNWKQTSYSFKTPANAKQITIFHYIENVGELTTDDFSLTTAANPTAPTVNVSSPIASSNITNSTTLSANASDAQGVSSVQFQVDGANVGAAVITAPYSIVWDSKTTTNAGHIITATATNTAGLSTTSAAVSVTVSNAITLPTAPTVSVTAPINGSTVSGLTSLTANASDTQSVSSVQFRIDGANISAADVTAPYNLVWDSTTTANGNHTITAVAINNAGLSTISAAIAVTVSNTATPPILPPATTNLIANPSVEDGSVAPTGWTGDGYGTNSHTTSYENSGHSGTKSLKTTITSYTNGDAKWMFNNVPVNAGSTYKYSNWYQSNVDTELDAAVTMSNGTVQYYYLATAPASATWSQLSTQFSAPNGAASVTVFQVLAKVGFVQTDDFSFSIYVPAKFSRGLVSLTFDDGWRSIATNGLPILKKYGLVSTQYVNSQPVLGSYPDYMTFQMIKDFSTQGSEIAWHTRSHADLTKLSIAGIDTELSIPTVFLTGTGQPAANFKNFATPYGAYNTTSVNEIKKFYRSHRSTDTGYNSKDNFNAYNIKVQNVFNTTTPAEVQGWVNQAVSTNTWLVIVYHEVVANAADPTYSVTPTNLDQELNLIRQSGVTVKTIDQALNEITPQL